MHAKGIDQQSAQRIAAIDLGTNSFHAVIADLYPDGSFRQLDDLKEMVELACGGLGKRLADDAFDRGIAALKRIKILCDSYDVDKILAYATSAIRESENGGDFIQASIDKVGIKINAIPGVVEAELIGYAVQHGVRISNEPVLVVDIGGGSVEFILMNNQKFHHLTSKKIGVSRMTDIFKPSDPITLDQIENLNGHYSEILDELRSHLKKNPTKTMIGSSGTMQSIALMIAARKGMPVDIVLNELIYSKAEFDDFYQSFIKLNEKERAKVPGMDSKRLRFINTGVVLVHWLFEHFGMEEMKISAQALREGIIIRYLKKEMLRLPAITTFTDPRRRSVFELLKKCNWHEAHSRHVTKMALILFDTLKTELILVDSDRELLEFAALMHDIGYHISHAAHHKHALYLIKHAGLKGFIQDEIAIMGHVARYHRRSIPKKRHEEFWHLSNELKERIKKLSGILRVADGLDRSHYQNVQELAVDVSDDQITLFIETIDEPHLEIWGAMRKSYLLSNLLSKRISIVQGKIK